MSPLIVSALVFVGVTAIVGVIFFVFGEGTGKTSERLDLLTGRKKKDDEATTILKKTALDRDKKSLLMALTPNLPSLQKLIIQADANITPSTFMAISLGLGVLGTTASWLAGVKIYFAPILGLLFLAVPFAWLLHKRSSRLKTFGAQLPDAELAAVLTHVRSQWGNGAAPVTADTVAAVRKETAARTEPFKGDAELTPLK